MTTEPTTETTEPTAPHEPEAQGTTAVVLSAHGSPGSLEELPAFLANIRRGRPAPPEVLAEVRRRYERIGGRSPLAERTARQATLLGEALGMRAVVAMRLWHPYPAEALAGLYAEGVRRVVSVPAAPFSVGVYHSAVREAVRALPGPVELLECAGYGEHPALARAWAALIERALRERVKPGARVLVLFTAHSLPTMVLARGDRYPQLVEQCIGAVVQACAPLRDGAIAYERAYQSQGMTSDEWLGPDLPTAFRGAKDRGFDTVLVAPVGFLADHVEVLYDLDVEAVELGAPLGLTVVRTEVLNEDPGLIEAMADAARAATRVAL